MANAKVRTLDPEQVAELALGELLEYEFATGAQAAAKARFAGMAPDRVAEAILTVFTAACDPVETPDPVVVTAVASFLVFTTGIDAARHAVITHFDGSPESLRLVELLGMHPPVDVPLETLVDFVAVQVPGFRCLLRNGTDGPVALAQALLEMPAALREPLVAGSLHGLRASRASLAFAALAVLFPYDAGTRRTAIDWLGHRGGAEATAFLANLAETDVDPVTFAFARATVKRLGTTETANARGLPGVPGDWPVIEAYASNVDGQGSQGFYVIRRISARKAALVGVVCNDVRGIADGMQAPEDRLASLRDLLDELSDGAVALTPVPAAYALQRIWAGIAQARALEMPLPHEFQACRYLLAGLPTDGTVDTMAAARQWADATALPDTHFLLHTLVGSSWYFDEADGPSAEFFSAGKKALRQATIDEGSLAVPAEIAAEADDPDGVLLWMERHGFLAETVAHEIARFFTPEIRERWSRRLAEMAFWFSCEGRPTMRKLAATAAVALDPASGTPMDAQPLAGALLRASLLAVYA